MSPRLIVSTPGTCSGEPRLAGTRICVSTLVERFMGGESFEAVARDYELEVADVEAAIRWHMVCARRRNRK